MPNIAGLLQIGRSALLTQQKAIDITGNNIANVNTPGYSRQRLNMEQATPVRVLNTTMSTGVVAQQKIQRFHDQFVQSQMNTENENLGRWEAQRNALEKIEVLFDEVSGYGLSTAMSGFWNSWQDLSNNPTGHVERNSVLSAGQYLTSTFNQLSKNIQNAQKDINTSINSVVTDINRMADQIAELNGKITKVEVTGHNANDYRDQRDLLVLELAKLIDIESFEDGDGNMTITVGNGKPLVERAFTWDLVTENIEGKQNVHWQDSSGNTLDITTHIQSGELKGWIEARDEVIEGYLGRLNELAENIISEVNSLHESGYGIEDDVQRRFFDPEIDGNALSIAIHPDIVANVNHIAAAGPEDPSDPLIIPGPGDNRNAIAIAELQNALTMSENASTFGDFYAALVGDVGNDTRRAGLNFGHQTAMMKHLSNYREEVAGVSLDEEMVNLVQYQHAYNAAAKLITTTDELMQTLIGLVR